MTNRLTAFFIVEPPDYEVFACYLAASLREQFGETIDLVGYCPDIKIGTVSAAVRKVLAQMGCEVRPFEVQGRFTPPYPHGNKILATLERRDTDYSVFIDSDVLCLRPNSVDNLIREGCVALTPAASMIWGNNASWAAIYGVLGMEVPAERIRLMRQTGKHQRVPYFSSGLFVFPEKYRTSGGNSFPEVWMEVAQRLDAHPDVPGKRPYLDQISLPLAIQKAGLKWSLLPEEQHYILGGRYRAQVSSGAENAFTVHYRSWQILKDAGLAGRAKEMMKNQIGVSKLEHLDGKGEKAGDRAKPKRSRAGAAVKTE